MPNRVYGIPAGSPSRNGASGDGTRENIPDDPLFHYLESKRKVSYEPLVADVLRHSEAPKRLLDRYTEAATLLFSNLLYWTPKSRTAGWVYKSRDEIWKETRLPRRRQDRARELLREAGIVEERQKRGRLYYRIRWVALKPLLRLAVEGPDDATADRHGDPGQAGSPCDPTQAGSPRDPAPVARLAIQGAGSPCDPPSGMDTGRDEHPVHVQSSSARANGAEDAYPDAADDDGWPGKKRSWKKPAADGSPNGSRGKAARAGKDQLSHLDAIDAEVRELAAEARNDPEAQALAGALLEETKRLPETRVVPLCLRAIRSGEVGALARAAISTREKLSDEAIRNPWRYFLTAIAGEEGLDAPRDSGEAPEEIFRAAVAKSRGRRRVHGRSSRPIEGAQSPRAVRRTEDYFSHRGGKLKREQEADGGETGEDG